MKRREKRQQYAKEQKRTTRPTNFSLPVVSDTFKLNPTEQDAAFAQKITAIIEEVAASSTHPPAHRVGEG